MDSVDIKIDENNQVVLDAKLRLGELRKEKGTDEEGNHFITMPIGTDFGMVAMENAVINCLNLKNTKTAEKAKEDIRKFMEEYAKYYLFNVFGVTQYPITIDDEGRIKGFKDDLEVNIINE